MHKSDYKRRGFDPKNMDIRDVDTTQLTRMCATRAANRRHKVNCSVCDDEVRFDGEDWGVGEFWGCEACNNQVGHNFDYLHSSFLIIYSFNIHKQPCANMNAQIGRPNCT